MKENGKIKLLGTPWTAENIRGVYFLIGNGAKALLAGLDLYLYLLHQPLGDYYGAWRAMEEIRQ